MAGMRYQPQGRVRPSTRLAGRAFGFLPGVSDLDVLGAQAALGIFNNPPRIGGAYGLARRFNGSNTYATSALPDFIDLSAPFTAVVAFVPNSRAISRIVHYAKAGISFQFTVQGNGTLNFMCGNSGGDTARATSNELLVVGQPYVAVAVYDGVGYSLYLNGVLQSGTPQASVDNGYSSVPLNLGRRSNASSYFGGDIALFAHLQGAHDGASLSANPWQLFADPYEDDEIAGASAPTPPDGSIVSSLLGVSLNAQMLARNTGAFSSMLSSTVLSSSGAVAAQPSGTLSGALASVTMAASGGVLDRGQIAATLMGASMAGSGTVASNSSGAFASQLSGVSASFAERENADASNAVRPYRWRILRRGF